MHKIPYVIKLQHQKNRSYNLLLLSFTCCLFLAMELSAFAQIVEDTSLPNNSQVNDIGGGVDEITEGTRPNNGSNLFHSFEEFSILEGRTARFVHDADIENIITRVTGESPSNIEGRIQTLIDGTSNRGIANLFFINPNGIMFGENATLDIGGSFIGSTANSIQFADGTEFSATNTQQTPLLSISIPIGLQYGTNPAAIALQGSGNNLFLDGEPVIRVFRPGQLEILQSLPLPPQPPGGLQVVRGQTLALVGGEITIEGGNLTAEEGRIELGSVGGDSLVTLTSTNPGFALSYEGVNNFEDISLSQASSLEVSGNGGGTIQVQGKQVSINDGSALLADTLGDGTGGNLIVRASDIVEVNGSSIFTLPPPLPPLAFPFVSRLSADVGRFPISTGSGGNVIIESDRLVLSNGGQISSGTLSSGNAGTLNIMTTQTEVIGTSELLPVQGIPTPFPSGLFTPVAQGATGQGGQLSITTDNLLVTDGAQISVSTFGEGDAGDLNIEAQEVEIIGAAITDVGTFFSALSANVETGASGDGGNLTITTDILKVTNGSQILTITSGTGDAGNLEVIAKDIELTGFFEGSVSALLANVEQEAQANGGNINIETENLRLADGAQIGVSVFGIGDGGSVSVIADNIEVSGSNTNAPSGLFTTVDEGAIGTGGNLLLETGNLLVIDGAQISVSTASSGNAGDLTVIASDAVELIGIAEAGGRSGLFATAIIGTGDGGNLKIDTDQLIIQDGAIVSVSNFSSSNSNIPAGEGAAGNLEIETNSLLLEDDGILSAEAAVGNRGNIDIQSESVVLRQDSNITTNAQDTATGGNITINTDTLVALENSDITANSQASFGGQVIVTAQSIFGTEFRDQLTLESDITASSALGAQFSGIVQLNTPDVDPSSGLIELSTEVVDPTDQIATGCPAEGVNVFTVTGRGGLPEAPSQTLRGRAIWQDIRDFSNIEGEISLAPSQLILEKQENNQQIIEAQGWVRNSQGKIILVSNTSQVIPNNPWYQQARCNVLS